VFTKIKIIRTATIAMSLDYLLRGQLKYLSQVYEVVTVSGQDEHLVNVAQREGVRTIDLEMQRPISPLRDIISLWRLYRLFRKERPLIVHSITPKAGLLSMIAAKMACVPIRMHTFTGLIFPTRKGLIKNILILMDKLLCKCATNIYPEGQGVKNDLLKYKITSKTLHIIANGNVNGIDLEYFSKKNISANESIKLKSDLGITEKDFVFIFIGRLVGDKGINELVTAFQKTEKEKVVKLVLVGFLEDDIDPLRPETKLQIQSNSNIIAVGHQADVRPYLAISDALVFPSYREGFPNVVMQAGAMELPSIVTDINGCNEIIIEGENGWIIPIKDHNAIYDSMKKMMEDSHLRAYLKKNARPMIVSRYSQEVVWKALLAEYQKLEKNV
jgi:glycosyltransferase involved in cell wall biosynthesis